jgi:hypothetical protein
MDSTRKNVGDQFLDDVIIIAVDGGIHYFSPTTDNNTIVDPPNTVVESDYPSQVPVLSEVRYG